MTKSKGVHIVPINDLAPHDDSGVCTCWCQPRVETLDPQTGASYPEGAHLVIHHSADGRELVERHGLQ